METQVDIYEAPEDLRSYPTYEEWKPFKDIRIG